MDEYEFLDSIHLGLVPDQDFFLKIYGFDISYYNFKDHALNELCRIGYPDPWKEYARVVTEYEDRQNAMFKRVAKGATQGGGMADGQ